MANLIPCVEFNDFVYILYLMRLGEMLSQPPSIFLRENHFMAFQGLRRGLISINSQNPNFNNLIEEEKDTIQALKKLEKEVGDGKSVLIRFKLHG